MIRSVLILFVCVAFTWPVKAQNRQCTPELAVNLPNSTTMYKSGTMQDSLTMFTHVAISYTTFLPTVFFHPDSTEISLQHYQLLSHDNARELLADAGQWIRGGALDKHSHVLNILGMRMQQFPQASVKLTGWRTKHEKPSVAAGRANAVARYLTAVWNIDSKRVQTVVGKGSSDDDSENSCRVDIASESWELLRPLTERDSATFPVEDLLYLYVDETCDTAQIINRGLLITIDSSLVLMRTPDNGLGTIGPGVWGWGMEYGIDGAWPQKSIDLQWIVSTADGNTSASTPVHFGVRKRLEEQIVFGCSRAYRIYLPFPSKGDTELTADHRKLIKEYITAYSKGCKEIYVIGRTDDIGSSAVNLRLSEQAAENVAREIRKQLKGKNIPVEVSALGEDEPLYSNNLASGRFLNRCVEVLAIYSLSE